MTVQQGDTGKVAHGTLRTFTTTLATPRETLIGTPVALPTTEPGTSQIIYTILTADLPTISPDPLSTKYTALLYAAGKNTDAAAQNVSWRVLKNGASVATGTQTSVTTNNFWTHGYYQFYDVVVGDVLEIRLWSPSANVNYDYYALTINPTRMVLGTSLLNKDVSYTNFLAHTLTLGTSPSVTNTSNFFTYPSTGTSTIALFTNAAYGALQWHGTYFSGRSDRGDNTISTATQLSPTSRPSYQRSFVPGTITFREVLR